jgi:hypothetical protein
MEYRHQRHTLFAQQISIFLQQNVRLFVALMHNLLPLVLFRYSVTPVNSF